MAGFFDLLVTRLAKRDIARAQNKRNMSTGCVESNSSIEKLSLQFAQPMS